MEYSSEVARIKKAEGLPIYHAEREQQILDRVKQIAGEGYSDYIIDIYRNIMAISRVLQNDELTTSQSEQLSANPITTPNEIVSHPLGDGWKHKIHIDFSGNIEDKENLKAL